MGFPNQQKENPVASAALTHSVLDQELFKLCFEQVVVSRIGGKRPSVASGASFDPAKCLTEALKDLVSRHKDCFQPHTLEKT
jgi:hypothetical protein